MRNLLEFFIRYNYWLLFIIYLMIGGYMFFSGYMYQQSVYLTSANAVSSSIYGTANSITGYFNLRSINDDLQKRNASLENEVLNLKNQIAEYQANLDINDSLGSKNFVKNRFDYVMASVINNSTVKPRNYFTINRGASDGIKPGMGVVDQNGVVGIVNVVGNHTARIISLLNDNQSFSVKVKHTPYVGSLRWTPGNAAIAYLEEMPRHVQYHIGDTIVTSGFSTTFPEGIPVGVIMSKIKTTDDNFFTLKVRLASDFGQLSTVRVIIDNLKSELDSLEMTDA